MRDMRLLNNAPDTGDADERCCRTTKLRHTQCTDSDKDWSHYTLVYAEVHYHCAFLLFLWVYTLIHVLMYSQTQTETRA